MFIVISYVVYLHSTLRFHIKTISEINYCVQVTQTGVCCKWSKPNQTLLHMWTKCVNIQLIVFMFFDCLYCVNNCLYHHYCVNKHYKSDKNIIRIFSNNNYTIIVIVHYVYDIYDA